MLPGRVVVTCFTPDGAVGQQIKTRPHAVVNDRFFACGKDESRLLIQRIGQALNIPCLEFKIVQRQTRKVGEEIGIWLAVGIFQNAVRIICHKLTQC